MGRFWTWIFYFFPNHCRWMMAPERPGPEDKPGVALVQRSGAVTIPVIPVISLPNTLVHLKVLPMLCDVLCKHLLFCWSLHIILLWRYEYLFNLVLWREMSSACSTHWRYKKLIKIDLENLQGKDKLGDLGTDGKIIRVLNFYMPCLNLLLLCCWRPDLNWALTRFML